MTRLLLVPSLLSLALTLALLPDGRTDAGTVVKAALPTPAALAVVGAEITVDRIFRRMRRGVEHLGRGEPERITDAPLIEPWEVARPMLLLMPLPAPAKSSLTPMLRGGRRAALKPVRISAP